MAQEWIKVEKATARKPEVLRISSALNIHPDHAFGLCVRFWCWCDDQCDIGHACGVTLVTLDLILGHTGFATQLVKAGWLNETDDGISIPHFEYHLSQSSKTRAQSAIRKERSRSKRDISHGGSVTKAGPDKSRLEKSIMVTDVVIPEKLNNAEARTAACKWFDYLLSKGLDDKVPPDDSPQMEAFWQDAARQHGSASVFADSVEHTMANGWRTLTKRRGAKVKADQSTDWIEAQKAVTMFPDDWQKRKEILGDERFEALKRTGTAKIKDANDFALKSLGELFESHLKDIRNGSKTGD